VPVKKKSRRFYILMVWNGEDVELHNQETGSVAIGVREPDGRRFTRQRAEEILQGLCANSPNIEIRQYVIREDT
jgi:hypothetical protein